MVDEKNVAEKVDAVPRCQTCRSERVVRDAWACFNPETGLWELEHVYDDAHCHQCDAAATLVWSKHAPPPQQRIRELNDLFRRDGVGRGSFMLTSGIQAHGEAFISAAVQAVREFNDFTDDNDPWGEHDFGAVEVEGQKVFWKISYYDLTLRQGSENPANESCTHRVLTVMLAEEY